MAYLDIDLTQVEESDVLPEGQYVMKVAKTEIRDTKSGAQYLSLQYEVLDGPCTPGRCGFDSLWLWGSKPEISKRTLVALAKACGHPHPKQLQDSDELLDARFVCQVRIERNEEYGDRNRFGKFRAVPSSVPTVRPSETGSAPAARPVVPAPPVARQAPVQPVRPAAMDVVQNDDEVPF